MSTAFQSPSTPAASAALSRSVVPSVEASWLARQIVQGTGELAWIDIREAGEYGEGHGLLAVNIPYSRLEIEIGRLVPRRDAAVVVSGRSSDDGRLAAEKLQALGYGDVRVLEGGIAAWLAAGQPVFKGVNVPSKAFAECVELFFHTPDIESAELARLQAEGADLVVLDSRTAEEFARFHVPGAISCPSSELVLHFADLVPSPRTQVVVSCAGRTRGVMGAQTLLNAGVPNPVRALSGGTQGWRLAGLELERNTPVAPRTASPQAWQQAREREARVAAHFGVPLIDGETAARWRADAERTTYFFDVRTPEEHRRSPLPGYTGVQGVQLVQCLDQWAVVRRARIVLGDLDGGRAVLTAHWLRQMGWDASVLQGEEAESPASVGSLGSQRADAVFDVARIDSGQAAAWVEQGALLLDASGSAAYLREHPAGAVWANRSALPALRAALEGVRQVVVLAEDEAVALLLARDLRHEERTVAVLADGLQAWRQAGLPVESGAGAVGELKRIDFLFWLHDRHEGNAESSAAYLAWEADLPRAIGDPATAGFVLQKAPAA